MPTLDQFPDFLQGTGELSVKGPMGLVNDATKHTYYVSRYFNGRSNKELRQGGSRMRTEHMFVTSQTGNSTAEFYSPATARVYTNPQVLQKAIVDWRFLRDDMTWEEQELLLNDGGGDLFQQFVGLRHKLEARVITSLINKMEANCWEAGSEADMEAQGGLKPYSFSSFINMGSAQTAATYQSASEGNVGTDNADYNNGLFNEGSGGAGAWSTKANLDPAGALVDGQWEAQFRTYVNDVTTQESTPDNLNDEGGLLAALDDMYLDVMFQRPPSFQAYFENQTLYGQHVCTSKAGINLYKRLLRASNDTLAMGHQDSGYNNPTIYGIDMLYISELNNAALYLNGDSSGLVSENVAAGVTAADSQMEGPAFYFIDANYLFPVFHSKRFMHRKPAINDRERVETWSVPVLNYYNQVPCSLRRMGLVKGDI